MNTIEIVKYILVGIGIGTAVVTPIKFIGLLIEREVEKRVVAELRKFTESWGIRELPTENEKAKN